MPPEPRCRLISYCHLCGLPETLELGLKPSILCISQCDYASSCSYPIYLALWRLAVHKERSAKTRGLNIVAGEASGPLEEYESEGQVTSESQDSQVAQEEAEIEESRCKNRTPHVRLLRKYREGL